jgi:zinc transporter ZupT
MIYVVTLAAFCATLLGGIFALRLRDRLHLVLGFSAGAIIAVAFFDLIPEALELASSTYDANTIASVIALGFAFYLILDRLIFHHGHGTRASSAGNVRGRKSFISQFSRRHWIRACVSSVKRGGAHRGGGGSRSRFFRWHQYRKSHLALRR